MTSKEILEVIRAILYENLEFQMDGDELVEPIKQDLDRLEKLEQFVDIYKNTNQRFTMLIQGKSSILPNPTLEQELLRKEILENEK